MAMAQQVGGAYDPLGAYTLTAATAAAVRGVSPLPVRTAGGGAALDINPPLTSAFVPGDPLPTLHAHDDYELRRELKALRDRTRLLDEEKNRLAAQVAVGDERVAAERRRTQAVEAELNRVQSDLRHLEIENAALRGDLARTAARLDDAQPRALRHSAAARRLQEIDAEYAAAGRHRDAAVAGHHEVDALSLRNAELMRELEAKNAQIRALEDRFAAEREHAAQLNSERQEHERVLIAKNTRIRALELALQDVQQNITQRKTEEIDRQTAEHEARMQREHNGELQACIHELEAALDGVNRKQKANQAVQEQALAQLTAKHNATVDALTQDLQRERSARTRAEQDVRFLVQEVQQLQQQVAARVAAVPPRGVAAWPAAPGEWAETLPGTVGHPFPPGVLADYVPAAAAAGPWGQAALQQPHPDVLPPAPQDGGGGAAGHPPNGGVENLLMSNSPAPSPTPRLGGSAAGVTGAPPAAGGDAQLPPPSTPAAPSTPPGGPVPPPPAVQLRAAPAAYPPPVRAASPRATSLASSGASYAPMLLPKQPVAARGGGVYPPAFGGGGGGGGLAVDARRGTSPPRPPPPPGAGAAAPPQLPPHTAHHGGQAVFTPLRPSSTFTLPATHGL